MIPDKLNDFVSSIEHYDWFCDAEVDNLNRLIVYVSKMDLNFIQKVPDVINGYHILFHFVNAQFSYKNEINLSNTLKNNISLLEKSLIRNDLTEQLKSSQEELNVDDLILELDHLRSICGTAILECIFYEEHDGKNAVTNLSAKFPEVRAVIAELYNIYGFDTIYEELGM